MAHVPIALSTMSSPSPRNPHVGRRSPMVCPLAKLGRSSPTLDHPRYRCSPSIDNVYRRSPLEPGVYSQIRDSAVYNRGTSSPLDPAVYNHNRSVPSPFESAVYNRGAPSPLDSVLYNRARGTPSPLDPAVYNHHIPPRVPQQRVPPPEPIGGFPNLSSTSPGSVSETSLTTYHPEMTNYRLPDQIPSRPLTDVTALYQQRLLSQDPLRSSPALRRASSPTADVLFPYQTQIDTFKVGRTSPSMDQGYHTLVSPSPGPSTPGPWTDFSSFTATKGKKTTTKVTSPMERLPDAVMVRIFGWLNSSELCVCARVCRRWNNLAWEPSLWRTVRLSGEAVCGDRAVRGMLRRLSGSGSCGVERVLLSDGARLSEKGLTQLARRCPDLTHLQLHGSTGLTSHALVELTARCTNLQHLDLTGCTSISTLSPSIGLESSRLLLQYLDLTDCSALDDTGLKHIVRSCPQLVYLYLRRCVQITDAGVKLVPSFCSGLRELSVSDCNLVTDFGLHELAKLGATLRYLSVAKCEQISDAGLKVVARRCYKLRYLNARGCEAVSDDSLIVLARSCPRLRALDIGKCDVSDAGLRALAANCPNLKKLGLRNCELVTDRGVQCVAYYCRGLQQLNIQDCHISVEGYRAVKKYCKRCVIEHTNPGFF